MRFRLAGVCETCGLSTAWLAWLYFETMSGDVRLQCSRVDFDARRAVQTVLHCLVRSRSKASDTCIMPARDHHGSSAVARSVDLMGYDLSGKRAIVHASCEVAERVDRSIAFNEHMRIMLTRIGTNETKRMFLVVHTHTIMGKSGC